jgi:hypothetical protein
MGLVAVSQRLLKGAHALAERVEESLSTVEVQPHVATALFNSIASTARQANETAKTAIAMERTLLGEPDKIIGHAHVHMTPTEAVKEIEAAGRAAERMRRRGLVVDAPAALPAE